MPTSKQLLSFYERSEGRLKFCIKANRLLTHEITQSWSKNADKFINAISVLQEKNCLASVLFQFPETFCYTVENRIYLNKLLKDFCKFNIVVEYRNAEWIRKSVFDGLEERNVSVAFCKISQIKQAAKSVDFIGPIAYFRLHNRNESSDFSEDEIASFKLMIQKAKNEKCNIQIYFNNQIEGVLKAMKLKEILNDSNLNLIGKKNSIQCN